MTLSERITFLLNKTIKEEKKYTQVDIAHMLNVAPAAVNKWLTGGSPSIDKLPKLCEILEITPNELFDFPTELSHDALNFYKEFQKYPEFREAIIKLLNLEIKDEKI